MHIHIIEFINDNNNLNCYHIHLDLRRRFIISIIPRKRSFLNDLQFSHFLREKTGTKLTKDGKTNERI